MRKLLFGGLILWAVALLLIAVRQASRVPALMTMLIVTLLCIVLVVIVVLVRNKAPTNEGDAAGLRKERVDGD